MCKGNFQESASAGAYIRSGDLTEGFLRYRFRGLIFGGTYTLRGLFSEFYGMKSPSRGSCLKTRLSERIEDLSETLVYYTAWKRGLSKVFFTLMLKAFSSCSMITKNDELRENIGYFNVDGLST